MTEDEMVGWHHRLNGHGFGWTLGIGDGQVAACCVPSTMTDPRYKVVNKTDGGASSEMMF